MRPIVEAALPLPRRDVCPKNDGSSRHNFDATQPEPSSFSGRSFVPDIYVSNFVVGPYCMGGSSISGVPRSALPLRLTIPRTPDA